MDSAIGWLLLSFNLTRPQRISERNNATYPASRSTAENTLNISGRQEIEEAIRKKRGGVWLELTPDQYAKLRQSEPRPALISLAEHSEIELKGLRLANFEFPKKCVIWVDENVPLTSDGG